MIVAGAIAAALGKSAQLPFSFRLSRAMEGPSPVSALLHSAAMVAAGGYLLIRLAEPLALSGWGDEAAAWAGGVTALVMGLVALVQRDQKQLLAASTRAQIGFVVMAAGVGARTGGMLQLVAHAAVKSLLFLCAGAFLALYGTRLLTRLSGALRRRPAVGVPTAVGTAALAGLPPLSLWAAKDEVLAGVRADTTPCGRSGSPRAEIFGAAIDGGMAWLAALGVANTVASLFYYVRWIGPAIVGRPSGDALAPAGRWTAAGAYAAAVAAVALGLVSGPVLAALDGPLTR